MTTIKLVNSFHGTDCRVSGKWGETPEDAWDRIQQEAHIFRRRHTGNGWTLTPARRAYLRVRKTLCGMADCKCGTVRA